MVEVFNALVRSLNNLQDGRIWSRLIGRRVVALLVWLLLAFFCARLVRQAAARIPAAHLALWLGRAVAGQGAGLAAGWPCLRWPT